MKSTAIILVILIVILFLGVVVMLEPASLVPSSISSESVGNLVRESNPLPKSLITLGSALLAIGLVGLSLLGFILKEAANHMRGSI